MSETDLQVILKIARDAGAEIMKVYQTDFSVSFKEADNSPLTQADLRANSLITSALSERWPGIPVLSEEGKMPPWDTRKKWKKFWLVDPLDGTREFVSKSGDFTVNIALVENHEPVLGVVFAPVRNVMYYAQKGQGAFRTEDGLKPLQLPLPAAKRDRKIIVASRSHLSAETRNYITARFPDEAAYDMVSVGSSLKICLVAEGAADIYPRLGPTMEWDTAAAHAIAMEAGRNVQIADMQGGTGNPLVYNKEDLLNPWFIVE